MENDIRSLTKEMKDYYLQITKADNDNSLTTIQKKQYKDSIQKACEAKGFRYFLFTEEYKTSPHGIRFTFTPWHVSDVGLIDDVRPEGAFPFSISIGDNISIRYDPRKVAGKEWYDQNKLKNNKFSNFSKGSKYEFRGKVSDCSYLALAKEERFEFTIIGSASNFRGNYCFIATACYGNYDAPEVLVLRQFRDDKLLKTFFGKACVKFYYSVSPFFAKLISKSNLLKKLVRQYFLEPIVTKLQRQK